MLNIGILLILVVAIAAGFAAWRFSRIWLRYLGRMVITCPENQRPAGVSVDAGHALATSLSGTARLRLAECSRWPERAACGQDCLKQIVEAPADCLVRNILVRWYEGKNCAWCGLPVGEMHWGERKPALLKPDQTSVEWNDVPADRLQETLETALPLCVGCHMANTMVRSHPELVIDRHRPPLGAPPRHPRAV
jgi:hypothetical protein